MKKLLITGGTGLLGKSFVAKIAQQGYDITLAGRRPPKANGPVSWRYFDLGDDGPGLDIGGFDTVAHLASNTGDLRADTDIQGIGQLLRALKAHPATHLVFISIVGVGTVPVRYFHAKKRAEDMIIGSAANFSILRATQFFEFFTAEIAKKLRHGVAIVPNLKYQPIAVGCVADRLATLCALGPTNTVEEVGGPEVVDLKRGIRIYQKITGNKTRAIILPNAWLGKAGNALTTGNALIDSPRWAAFLEKTHGKHSPERRPRPKRDDTWPTA